MNRETILGVLRHVFTFGGGYLASRGLATGTEVEQLAGALVTVVGVVWSIVAKRNAAPTAK